MIGKNFEIGETITLGKIKLQVFESDDKDHCCRTCYFSKMCLKYDDFLFHDTLNDIVGQCTKRTREDNKEVMFLKIS